MQAAQRSSESARAHRAADSVFKAGTSFDRDVVRGRVLDPSEKFLSDDLTQVDRLVYLSRHEQRFLGQIEARTFINLHGLLDEAFACEPFDDGFRHIDALANSCLPEGYELEVSSDDLEALLRGKSKWAVLALACAVRLCWEACLPTSIARLDPVSSLFKDMTRYLAQAARSAIDKQEMDWRREDSQLQSFAARDAVAHDFQALLDGLDGILQRQAQADARYFMTCIRMEQGRRRSAELEQALYGAYRWQLVVRGSMTSRFQKTLGDLVSDAQSQRIQVALCALVR